MGPNFYSQKRSNRANTGPKKSNKTERNLKKILFICTKTIEFVNESYAIACQN